MTPPSVEAAIIGTHQQEWGRVVASVARKFGDLDIAEEATAEAFAIALERWPADGVPANPAGWIMTTATRKAIDRLRREARRVAKQQDARLLVDDAPLAPSGPIEDDRLRLIFTCCHPALTMESRVALTLRLLGGLTVPEIAHAFLVQESALAARITRAKAKIRATHLPLRVPSEADIAHRLPGVLAVVFLIFNEGYLPSSGAATRVDLSSEAIRLGRMLHALLPDVGEVAGLLALMLLIDARRPARLSSSGGLVVLPQQDRSLWDQALVAEGQALVRSRIRAVATGADAPGRYQLLAAINATHVAAGASADTRWADIVTLYDRLTLIDPSPIVRLNRAVAVAEVDGPRRGLDEIDEVAAELDGYHALHVARAELLRRLSRDEDARLAYGRALDLTDNPAERAYLAHRRASLLGTGGEPGASRGVGS